MTWCAPALPQHARGFTARRRRVLAIAMLMLLVPLATGCLRARASLTISPDDLVSGEIIAAAKPKTPKDTGPQLDTNNLPFSQKVAVSNYDSDGYVGSQAVFSDLTFGELPQLANMNSDAAGVNLSLRRNGNLVILEGRADLTSVTDPRRRRRADRRLSRRRDLDQRRPRRARCGVVEAQAGRGEHDDRPGPLHRPQHPFLHRRGRMAGHRVLCGGRRGRAAGLDEPGPLRAVHRTPRSAAQSRRAGQETSSRSSRRRSRTPARTTP